MSRAAGEALEPPDQGWYQERFDEIVGGTLELAAAAGAILFVVFAVLNLFLFDPPASYALSVVALATAVVAGTLWWWARTRRLSSEMAHPAVAVGLGTILVHTFAAARVQATPEMTFWFALVALAGGVLFLAWRWYASLATAVLVAWGVVAYTAAPDPGWLLHGPFVLVAALVLGGITLESRRRVYRNLLDRELRLRRVNRELDEARRKAERAEEMQSRFVANVSHDVRTPASAIVGEARELREHDLDEEHVHSLETIEESARHLVRLFDDLLDVSMAEAGQLSVREEVFEIEPLLHQSLDMVAGQARGKGLELSCEVGEGVPSAVRSDPHRLKQILGNLLSNAVKFTHEGHVRLRASLENGRADRLRLEVEDTGPGIPEGRQGELFRPFSRLETSEAEGTGLGLAICKRLVGVLGGEIGLSSAEGEGSTFWFTLPVEPADPEDVEGDRKPVRLTGREAWIVGTDGFPAGVLERWGFETEAMAGIRFVEQALEADRRPSLVVLDLLTIQAPEAFLAERVRAWRARGIPVLVAKPEGAVLEQLEDVPGPGGVITPGIAERDLHELVTESLREGGTTDATPSLADPATAERHPLEILVVEDSPVNRRLLALMLRRLGYEPARAADGEEALGLLRERVFDLVLLDLGLPDVRGEELADRVRREIDPPPRLVALSGYADEETIEAARAAGIEAHLVKPAELADVVDQIEQTPRLSREDAGEETA